MHPETAARLDEIAALCRDHGVRRLEVFGSAARGEDFDPERSDVDFLVEFSAAAERPWMGEYAELQRALESLLKRPVDLVGVTALAAMRNRFRRQAIEEDRRVVFAA